MKYILILTILFLPLPSHASQDQTYYDLGEVVVTATRIVQNESEIGSAIDVVTNTIIDQQKVHQVLGVVRNSAGIGIVQSGDFGGASSIYVRGANSSHTLVMLDGIELNDPMSPDRGFNFAHFVTPMLGQIEMVRGPKSTLYGSNAMGGVVNMITKKGQGYPSLELNVETGAHGTFRKYIGLEGKTGIVDYNLGVIRTDIQGISKAAGGAEHDAYKNTTFRSKYGIDLYEGARLESVVHYVDVNMDVDDGAFEDDVNAKETIEQFMGSLVLSQVLTSYWDHRLSVSVFDITRKNTDLPDSIDMMEYVTSKYSANQQQLYWQHMIGVESFSSYVNDMLFTLAGEYEVERGSSMYYSENAGGIKGDTIVDRIERKTVSTTSGFLQNQTTMLENLTVISGVRVDYHQEFGDHTTYNISSIFHLPLLQTDIKANIGTGFKSPSIYQLYSIFGYEKLQPETSRGYDIGFTHYGKDKHYSFTLIHFYNEFKNMINTIEVSPREWKYQNVASARTKGLELEVMLELIPSLRVIMNYTYLKTLDKTTMKELARRPADEFSATLDYDISDNTHINMTLRALSSYFNDVNNRDKMPGYYVIDYAMSHQLSNEIEIYTKVNNLCNHTYQQVKGYGTEKRAWYGGIKGKF